MTQVNKISTDDYSKKIWVNLTDDGEWVNTQRYKRGTLVDILFSVTEEMQKELFPDNPELIGNWMAYQVYHDYDDGLDVIDELERVEKHTITVTTEQWVPVK